MPAKPSGKIKTYISEKKQKNGDTYVYERLMKYDPELKQNVQLGSRLIGKRIQGTGSIVPTRPKRRTECSHNFSAFRDTAISCDTMLLEKKASFCGSILRK